MADRLRVSGRIPSVLMSELFLSSSLSLFASHHIPQDKNPSPLNQLDFLMDETYSSIMDTGTVIDVAQEELEAAANKLACTVNLIVMLIRWVRRRGVKVNLVMMPLRCGLVSCRGYHCDILDSPFAYVYSFRATDNPFTNLRYRFSCTDDEYAVLRSYLSPEVLDGPEIGWEEHVEVWQRVVDMLWKRIHVWTCEAKFLHRIADRHMKVAGFASFEAPSIAALTLLPPSFPSANTQTGMMQLLRSCLAKSAKESAVSIPPPVPAKDTSRLKKHIGSVGIGWTRAPPSPDHACPVLALIIALPKVAFPVMLPRSFP